MASPTEVQIQQGQIEKAVIRQRAELGTVAGLETRYAEAMDKVVITATPGERLATIAQESIPNRSQIKALAETHLRDRDAAGNLIAMTPTEQTRYNETEANLRMLHDIYNADTAQLLAYADAPQLQGMLEAQINGDSQMAQEYANLTSNVERRAFRAGILGSQEMKASIADTLRRTLDVSEPIADSPALLDERVANALAEKTAAEAELKAARDEGAKIDTELREYTTYLDTTSTPPTTKEGAFVKDMQSLEADIAAAEGDSGVKGMEDQVKNIEATIQAIRDKLPGLLADESMAQPEIDYTGLNNRKDAITKELQEFEEFVDMSTTPPSSKKGALASERETLQGEIEATGGEAAIKALEEQVRAIDAETATTNTEITKLTASERAVDYDALNTRREEVDLELLKFSITSGGEGEFAKQIRDLEAIVARKGNETTISSDSDQIKAVDTQIAELRTQVNALNTGENTLLDAKTLMDRRDEAEDELEKFEMVGGVAGEYLAEIQTQEGIIAAAGGDVGLKQIEGRMASTRAALSQSERQLAQAESNPALNSPDATKKANAEANRQAFRDDVKHLRDELNDFESKYNENLEKINAAKAVLESLKTKKAQLTEDRKNYNALLQKGTPKEKVDYLKTEITALETERAKLLKANEGKGTDVARAKQKLETLRDRKAQLEAEKKALDSSLASGKPEDRIAYLKTRMTELADQRKKVTDELEAKKKAVAEAQQRLKNIDDRQTALKAEREVINLQLKVGSSKEQVKYLMKQADDLEAKKQTIVTRIETQRKDLGGKKARLAAIRDRKTALEAQKAGLPARITAAETAVRLARDNHGAEVMNREQARVNRENYKNKFAARTKEAVARGAVATINADIRNAAPRLLEAEAAHLQAEKDAATTARDAAKVHVMENLSARFAGARADQINWGHFNADWNQFLNPNGDIEALALSAAVRAGLTPAEITLIDGDAKLRQEIVDDYKAKMAKLRMVQPNPNILFGTRRMRPLGENETRRIIAAIGPDYVDQILATDKDAQDRLQAARVQGLGRGFQMKDAIKNFPWSTTALILGIVFGVPAAGAAITSIT